METLVNFVNYSHSLPTPDIVLFQQDRLQPRELPVVWRVIRHCGYECTHPFRFSVEMQLGIFDAWGNRISQPKLLGPTDVVLADAGGGRSRTVVRPGTQDVVVSNSRDEGVLYAFLARDGRAVTPWRTLEPGTSTRFRVDFHLSLLPWNGLRVGEEIPRAALPDPSPGPSSISVLDLRGVASTDMYLLGGGHGPSARRFRSVLHNTRYGVSPY